MAKEPMDLPIGAIPPILHTEQIRAALGPKRWKRLRDGIVEQQGRRCRICGLRQTTERRLHGHEVWDYALDPVATATLVRIDALCWHCHMCHHIGMLAILSDTTLPRAWEDTKRHWSRVTRRRPEEFEELAQKAMSAALSEPDREWRMDFGPYADLVEEVARARELQAPATARRNFSRRLNAFQAELEALCRRHAIWFAPGDPRDMLGLLFEDRRESRIFGYDRHVSIDDGEPVPSFTAYLAPRLLGSRPGERPTVPPFRADETDEGRVEE